MKLAIGHALVVSMLCSCRTHEGDDEAATGATAAAASAPHTDDETMGEAFSTSPPHYDRGQPAFYGHGLVQTVFFENALGTSRLIVRNRYPSSWLDAALNETADQSFAFHVPFELHCLRSRTRDHFYGAGRTPSGEDVLVSWRRSFRSAQPGIGPSTAAPYGLTRSELYRGSLGGVKAIGVDHRDRFLLILHGTPSRLSRLSLPPVGPPVTLFTSQDVPALNMPQQSIFPRLHAAEGLIWTVEDHTSFGSDRYVLFRDALDDGMLDSWVVLDRDSYFATYGAEHWTDYFLSD